MRYLTLLLLFSFSSPVSAFDFSRLERPASEPGEIASAFREACAFTEERDWEKALISWQGCVQVWTDAAEPYYNMGLCSHYAGKDLEDITSCYDAALKRDPCEPLTRYIAHNKGIALLQHGQIEEGFNRVSWAAGKDRAKRIDAFLLGAAYSENHQQWKKAADLYKEAKELWVEGKTRLVDSMTEKEGKELFDFLASRCESHLFESNANPGLRGTADLLKKIEIRPFTMGRIGIPHLFPLAKAYIAEDKTDKAMERAEILIQLSPEELELTWWGDLLAECERKEEAAEIMVDIALKRAKEENWEEATAAANNALSLNPACSRAETMLSYLEALSVEISVMETYGAWNMEVLFCTKTERHVVKTPKGPISFDAKGNECVAVVEVQCTRLRDHYTEAEFETLKSHPAWQSFETVIGFCTEEILLGTPCFTLMYTPSEGSQNNVSVSDCLSMEGPEELKTFYFDDAGQAVGCTDADTVNIKLLFILDQQELDPILVFEPVPKGASQQAARLILGKKNKIQVEYGDLKKLAKRSFPKNALQ